MLTIDEANPARVRTINWTSSRLRVAFTIPVDGPVAIESVLPDELNTTSSLVTGHPLVEIFTASEQRARTSQNYTRSAVGRRLRYVGHRLSDEPVGRRIDIEQHDDVTGITVVSSLTAPKAAAAMRIEHEVTNDGTEPLTLTAVTSAAIGFGAAQSDLDRIELVWGESEWLAENRWHQQPLREVAPQLGLRMHGQDGRGRFAVTNHGAWSTGEYLPGGILFDTGSGAAIAWQIESSGAWHWEIGQTTTGGFLSVLGPADNEHHFADCLEAGQRFRSVPAALAFSSRGRDGAVAELTRYRRSFRHKRDIDDTLPVIYNDFMNTLSGSPSTERLLPLIAGAAKIGTEYFCIDAGWYADTDNWWDAVGDWREGPTRFTGGLRSVIAAIGDHGMKAGLWLEPEVIGVRSAAAKTLPNDAFFQRFGERVLENGRYHLDFRHPAARAHLDQTIEHLVGTYGVSYFKLDYNINPGPGTSAGGEAAGAGLLGHNRAYRSWLLATQENYPDVLFENCSSGAMRMDYALVSATHLQSTSDQQDYLLYPPIAASAPLSVPPEQCGNWAYPSTAMTLEETAFCLISGLIGRLYLSGFLADLSREQQLLVAEAVQVSKAWRTRLADSTPFWPNGLPGWQDDVVILGLDLGEEALIAVWSRSTESRTLTVAAVGTTAHCLFPDDTVLRGLSAWEVQVGQSEATFRIPAGPTARLYRFTGPRVNRRRASPDG